MSLPAIVTIADMRLATTWDKRKVQRFMDRNRLTLRENDDPKGRRYTTPERIERMLGEDAARALALALEARKAGRAFSRRDFDDLDTDEAA